MTSDAEDTKGLCRASSAIQVLHDEHRTNKQKTAVLCSQAYNLGKPWLGGLGPGPSGAVVCAGLSLRLGSEKRSAHLTN